tara:strand:- start:166 stop:861 length:696 start_codon:yes stop_codon:yes gene_type:complete
MPRKARVLVPNCPHHIVQRGHNRKAVFLADQDYQYYLENLKEWKKALGVKLYAWCLMTNHIHIIAEPAEDAMSLSKLMKRVNGRQSAYVNKLEGRSGSLWEGRYKASPIQKDEYLLACVRYVELNPIKAGMVKVLKNYPWSSYRERAGLRSRDMLDLDSSYQSLGHTEKDRRHHYHQYLIDGSNSKETALISERLQRNQLTGNHRFIDEIENRIGLRVENRGRGRLRNEEK